MNPLARIVTLALAVSCVASCRSKAESVTRASSASAGEPSAPPASAVASAPVASTSAAVVLPEPEVKGLLERWEAAQNRHDFSTYSALYAERFMGVKRVGTYSKRFDRKGWLADRKPMFDAGAKVTISDLELLPAAGATRAIFTQEFASSSFRDTGKKELFLIATPRGIAIAREEMLSSDVRSPGAASDSVLAYHRDGAVVRRSFDKNKLATPPQLLSKVGESPVDIAFDVSPEQLEVPDRAWLGREVTAYTIEGESCTGRVARFQVRVQAVPHFGMLQQWNGELGGAKSTPAQVAKTISGMAQREEHFVVGVLDRACTGTWATAAKHTFTSAAPAQGQLREAAVAALRRLPAYAKQQQRFVKETGDASRAWETVDGKLSAVELRVPGHPTWILVSAHGGAGCASFSGSLSALWQVGGSSESPHLIAVAPSFEEFLTLRGALDQGEAGLALLTGPDAYNDEVAIVRVAPKAARRVVHMTSFWDCDC